MCGIFAYTGKRPAQPLLVQGLKDLEYRGYDSAGVFIAPNFVMKRVGQVANLEAELVGVENRGGVGIAHTRWATHGQPTETNCHPHFGGEKIYVVHNGIVENYQEIKQDLKNKGYAFQSDTDSEVLAVLIEDFLSKTNNTKQAVIEALKMVRGTYGIAVVNMDVPDEIVAARWGSPIVLGIGEGENFIASDPSAILKHTKKVVYLDDGELAVVSKDNYQIFGLEKDESVRRLPELIDWDVELAQEGGYDHFMMKEIMESVDVLENSSRGRLDFEKAGVKLGGLEDVKDQLANIDRLVIVGCGSAYYAGLAGKYMIEEEVGIPVDVEVASEFRYSPMLLDKKTALLAVSQSGETADTLACIRMAKDNSILTLGIVNAVGSTIARETDAGIYNHAGPEIGVASTKAFVSQLEVFVLLSVFLGRLKGMNHHRGMEIISQIQKLPNIVNGFLENKEQIKAIAQKYIGYRDFLYIGRKSHFPIALEGALKLKEVSYIHAEGYGAGEMKHGPLAMIDPEFPTVALAPEDDVYEKMVSNIQEIRARKGKVILVTTVGNRDSLAQSVEDVIFVPKVDRVLQPILSVIPLQLLAYYVGNGKVDNVDRPRNLAKSVTVE